MTARPAAGGGRWVDVDPARLQRWLDGFGERHGSVTSQIQRAGAQEAGEDPTAGLSNAESTVRLTASDGATAELYAPPGAAEPTSLDQMIAEARRPRRLGLILARQSAVAIGVADGERLVVSKVDSSYVQGRTAAGGWSQHRFARRRENQAKAAAGGAADIAVRLLQAEVGTLAAVVTGGDRRAIQAVLSDPRLAAVRGLQVERFLDVPEPRLAVLEKAVGSARAVRILVRDPPGPSD